MSPSKETSSQPLANISRVSSAQSCDLVYLQHLRISPVVGGIRQNSSNAGVREHRWMHVELLCDAFHLHCGFSFLFGVGLVFVSFVWLRLWVPPEREVCGGVWILLWFSRRAFSARLLEAAVVSSSLLCCTGATIPHSPSLPPSILQRHVSDCSVN